jgi:t-SNARE complex subunit (syntaxin)
MASRNPTGLSQSMLDFNARVSILILPRQRIVYIPKITAIQDGIAQFKGNVARISDLRSRSLDAMQDFASEEATQLETLVAKTRALSDSLKQQIAALNTPATSQQDAQIRRNQV